MAETFMSSAPNCENMPYGARRTRPQRWTARSIADGTVQKIALGARQRAADRAENAAARTE